MMLSYRHLDVYRVHANEIGEEIARGDYEDYRVREAREEREMSPESGPDETFAVESARNKTAVQSTPSTCALALKSDAVARK